MPAPVPESAAPPRICHRTVHAMAWGIAILLGLGAGAWVSRQYVERERAEGVRVATTAAELTAAARKADRAGDRSAAEDLLRRASLTLEEAGPGASGNAYATVLADLASLYLLDAADGGDAGQGRQLLERAWQTEGVGDPLRARIARDLGAATLLAGDLDGARRWYLEAVALDPGNPELEARLSALSPRKPEQTGGR